jgi:hypothetical protein
MIDDSQQLFCLFSIPPNDGTTALLIYMPTHSGMPLNKAGPGITSMQESSLLGIC